jgi:hypothetical protein
MTGFPARRYQLQREPGVPVLTRAAAYAIPATTPDDYARFAVAQPDATAPVLLDHVQYTRFLSELVDAIWRELGQATRIFMRFRAPYNGSLPANLLDPRVLIGSGLHAQMAFWTAYETQPAISLVDRIRRDLDYPGDNTLDVSSSSDGPLDALEAILLRGWPRYAVRLDRLDSASSTGTRFFPITA